MSKRRKRRSRGGASCPCPQCGAHSRVLETRRTGEMVKRQRVCANDHLFNTRERVSR